MLVHDPNLSTFMSAGVDSTGKHTQANALPMGIHFNTSFGQASISRSSLWALFLVVSWVLCLSESQQGLQPPLKHLSLAVAQLLHHSNLTFWERDAGDLWIKAMGGYQH